MRKNNKFSTGRIRIIGGQWKGRKLLTLNSFGLRPTMNLVKETLFNWLIPFLPNTRCLDCFAGSGSLGIEALSRHAASVTLLEVKFKVAKKLQQNLITLKASNARVINENALVYLSKFGIPYDIVFIDPPFYKGEKLLKKTLNLLEQNNWLSENALIYVESEVGTNSLQPPVYWKLLRKRTAGRVLFYLFCRKAL